MPNKTTVAQDETELALAGHALQGATTPRLILEIARAITEARNPRATAQWILAMVEVYDDARAEDEAGQ